MLVLKLLSKKGENVAGLHHDHDHAEEVAQDTTEEEASETND